MKQFKSGDRVYLSCKSADTSKENFHSIIGTVTESIYGDLHPEMVTVIWPNYVDTHHEYELVALPPLPMNSRTGPIA